MNKCQETSGVLCKITCELTVSSVCFVFVSSYQLVQVKQSAISKKKDSRNAVALDSENNNIQVKDIVKVNDGPHSVSSRFGRLKFIFA